MNTEKRNIHIFKAGRHTDMHGQSLEITPKDIAASAGAYDPGLHEAPLVLGHPEHNHPAYGWVQDLKARDGNLVADVDQMPLEFVEDVKSGRYKKVSASFYPPEHPANPVPGVYYLRHVGFLGAQPPAIKGLREVSFSDGSDNIQSFETETTVQFMEGTTMSTRKSDAQPGVDAGAAVAAAAAAKNAAATNPPEAASGNTANPSAPEIAAMQEELRSLRESKELAQKVADHSSIAKLQKEIDELKAEQKLKENQASTARNMEFTEQLVGDGKLPEGKKGLVVAVLGALESPVNGKILEFAEGDSNEPLADAFRNLLGTATPMVSFGEFATKSKSTKGKNQENPLLAEAKSRAKSAKGE